MFLKQSNGKVMWRGDTKSFYLIIGGVLELQSIRLGLIERLDAAVILQACHLFITVDVE